LCALAATAALSTAALAKPNHPINAATTDSGTGCLVRDGAGAYHFDAACRWHLVRRRDKDGNLVLYSYQDHGSLPAGAPRPSSASRHSGPWPGCIDGINEVTTPSGEYRSDCRFHN
jgi:hypothetical protein